MRHSIRGIGLGLAIAVLAASAMAQTSGSEPATIPLYPKGSRASLGVPEIRETLSDTDGIVIRNVSEPTLELFRPARDRGNGTAVIIAPGGGFVGLGYDAEGTALARQLVRRGVTALVLKYRTIKSGADPTQLPEVHLKEMDLIMKRAKSGVPAAIPPFAGEQHAVEDGARAMAIVRQRAQEWHIDPRRVGLVGFSAGAFLAARLAIGDKLARPDFVAMLYGGLRTPVPSDAPPAFIAGASDDDYLPGDSLQLYEAWRKAGVAAELHLYERGGHGFGLKRQGTTSDHWYDALTWWMQARGLMTPTKSRSR